MRNVKASIPAREMDRGETPSEAGWYLILWKDGTVGIHEVVAHAGKLHLLVYGIEAMLPPDDAGIDRYVHQVYPDRAAKAFRS